MDSYYNNNINSEIKARVDIVQVISEVVELKQKGNRYWGLCPFHKEKTPSFCVYQQSQMYYCFGCHAKGDVFGFIMQHDQVGFRTAWGILASRAGISIDTSPEATTRLLQAKQQRKIRQEKEQNLKKLIDQTYNKLVEIEQWARMFKKHIYTDHCLDRTSVIWALHIKDKASYYLDCFLNGTASDKLEIALMVRGWELPWKA